MSAIKQNIIANFAGNGWTALMSLAFVPLYIRFMGVESYGLVGIFATLLALFGLLDLGLSTTLNRELARLSVLPDKAQDMRNLVRTLELPYWGMAFVIGIAVIGLSGPIAYFWVNVDALSPATVQQALMIMGVVVAFRWPSSLYAGGLMGLQKQVLLNGINAFAATLRSAGAALVLWLISPTIQAFFFWQIFSSVVHTFLVAGFLWYSLPKSSHRSYFQKEVLQRIWRFTAGMTGISVTAIILTQTDRIILSKMLTLEMFGYYTLAAVVVNTLYYFVGPLNSAVFPRFAQLVSLQDELTLKEIYHKSCQVMSVIILPVAIVVSLFSFEILLLWTGNPVTVANTHKIVSILIIGTALNGLMNLPYALQLANAWTNLSLYTNIIASVMLVPMIYFLTMHYGVVGAASAWVVLNTGYILIGIPAMHSRLLKGEQRRWYLNDVGIPLSAALSMALTGWFFKPDGISGLAMLIYLIAVLVTTLLAATYATSVTRQWLGHNIARFKII